MATRLTYREAAAVLSEELGTRMSGQSVHGWVKEFGHRTEARGLSPPSALAERRELVIVEWDETVLRSHERGERQSGMKLGIGYSQERQVGPKCWKLTDQVGYGGVEEAETFAERFYDRMGGCFQLSGVAHLVVKGDGAEWICQGADQVFPGYVFQLDRWHLLDRIEKFAGHLPRVWKRLRSWVYEGRVESLVRSLSLIVGADTRSEKARQELLHYVSRHARAITAVDRLRPQVSPAARPLLTHGAGAMEKNIEVLIARRFKRWGMRWTRRGAQALLKLRLWIVRHGEG